MSSNGNIEIAYEGEDAPKVMNIQQCENLRIKRSEQASNDKDIKWIVGGCVELPGDYKI